MNELVTTTLASLQRPEIKLQSLKEDIKEFFKISGWEKKLQNAVYSELSVFPLPSHPAAPPEHLKEPLVYMRKAQTYPLTQGLVHHSPWARSSLQPVFVQLAS
ncbi:TBC1 domain family member 19-like [Mustela nigripes]|uniref:TBC1 domain family member 19-like n=1 Tax=Mustela nigripes TaxID=77151 RepID=UPI0028160433|nr:TBC1 domain family member 19-like [Mustela nigripes]